MLQPAGNNNSTLSLFVPRDFDEARRMAKNLAYSELVPDSYRVLSGRRTEEQAIGSCLLALDTALRSNSSILMVMQHLNVIHGRATWSSQYLIASFNVCGRYSSIQYTTVGKQGEDDYGCYAWAVEFSSNAKVSGIVITMGMAKKEGWSTKPGSKWHTMPDQMLRYRAAAFFIRTIAPEISMGLLTSEEANDIYDVTPGANETGESRKKYSKQRIHGVDIKEEVIDALAEGNSIPNPIKENVNAKTGEVKKADPHEILKRELSRNEVNQYE